MKSAIVVVSFGTTLDEARVACIESVEKKIALAFADYEVRCAFTSRIIIRKLAERGICRFTLEQVLEQLKVEGYQNIIIQSMHLTPGEEYEKKIVQIAKEYESSFASVQIGRPILTEVGQDGGVDDFMIAAKALQTQFPTLKSYQEIVFMGHGSPHQHNVAYELLQKQFDLLRLPVTVGVLEKDDFPNINHVLKRLKTKAVDSVILMPLLLVAGNHVEQDMAGKQETSWKSILSKAGYKVTCYLHGLGENQAIQEIFVAHIKDAMHGK